MKIVRNTCFGGFGLSALALCLLSEMTGKSIDQCREDYEWNVENRSAPELVQVVNGLHGKANGSFAALEVVEIPDDVNWCISDYDGIETIEEVYRSW